MASGNGSWVYSSNNRMRLTWQTDQSPSSVGSASSVTIRLRIWFESQYSVIDSSNSFTVSGAWPSRSGVDVNINHGSSGGTTLIYDQTTTVSTKIGATVASKFSASLTGINAISGTAKASGTHTTGARITAPSKPAKPTISSITSTGATAKLASAPANNGSAITRYEWQVNSGSWIPGTTSLSRAITGLSPNSTNTAKVRAVNAVGTGPASDASAAFTTKPNRPLTPTGTPTVARVSDTQQNVTIPYLATSAAPLTGVAIYRQTWNGTAWGSDTKIATVTKAATSNGSITYQDKATSANAGYRYRAAGVNSAGEGSKGPLSAAIYTTPAAPSGITATKSGTTVTLSATDASKSNPTRTFGYQDNPDGTGFVALSGTTTTPTRTLTGVSGSVTHQYRMNVSVASGGTSSVTLTSVWSTATGVIQTLTPPLAPTLTAPDTGVRDRDLDIPVGWTHNPVDATAQTAAKVQYRLNGGAWTEQTVTTAKTLTIPALGESGTLEIQAATKGEHATYGPWSTSRTVTLAAVPETTILTPAAGTVITADAALEWVMYAADGAAQVAWQAWWERYDAEAGVWAPVGARRTGTTQTTTSFPFSLENYTTYRATIITTAASGLRAEPVTVEIATDFPPPQQVTVTGEWDRPTGSVGLTPHYRQDLPATPPETALIGAGASAYIQFNWPN